MHMLQLALFLFVSPLLPHHVQEACPSDGWQVLGRTEIPASFVGVTTSVRGDTVTRRADGSLRWRLRTGRVLHGA